MIFKLYIPLVVASFGLFIPLYSMEKISVSGRQRTGTTFIGTRGQPEQIQPTEILRPLEESAILPELLVTPSQRLVYAENYFLGIGVPKDLHKAYTIYQSLMSIPSTIDRDMWSRVHLRLGEYEFYGYGDVPKDSRKAFETFHDVATQGTPLDAARAQVYIALLYVRGQEPAKLDLNLALSMLMPATEEKQKAKDLWTFVKARFWAANILLKQKEKSSKANDFLISIKDTTDLLADHEKGTFWVQLGDYYLLKRIPAHPENAKIAYTNAANQTANKLAQIQGMSGLADVLELQGKYFEAQELKEKITKQSDFKKEKEYALEDSGKINKEMQAYFLKKGGEK